MALSELRRTSMAIRWLLSLEGHGDVPGEIQASAEEARIKLDELRRKFFRAEAIERSIVLAWTGSEPEEE